MTRQEELLRQACALLAQDETDQLERQLTDAEIQEAEALFTRHRRNAFRVIARYAGSSSGRRAAALRIAACLVLIAGALYLGLRPFTPPDPAPLASAPSPSVAPYYSPVPSSVPAQVPADTPTPAPGEALSPTSTPQEAPDDLSFSTSSPIPSETPHVLPTETPFVDETESPAPTETPPAAAAPSQWTGAYFPQFLPRGYSLSMLIQEDGAHTAAYTRDDRELVFTEYDEPRSVTVPGQAQRDYAQLSDGSVVLRLASDEGVMLAWDVGGRTLTLFGEEADVLAIADSVIRLKE